MGRGDWEATRAWPWWLVEYRMHRSGDHYFAREQAPDAQTARTQVERGRRDLLVVSVNREAYRHHDYL